MKIQWDYTKNGNVIIALNRQRISGWFRSVSAMRRNVRRQFKVSAFKDNAIFWTGPWLDSWNIK